MSEVDVTKADCLIRKKVKKFPVRRGGVSDMRTLGWLAFYGVDTPETREGERINPNLKLDVSLVANVDIKDNEDCRIATRELMTIENYHQWAASVMLAGTFRCSRCRGRINRVPCMYCAAAGVDVSRLSLSGYRVVGRELPDPKGPDCHRIVISGRHM